MRLTSGTRPGYKCPAIFAHGLFLTSGARRALSIAVVGALCCIALTTGGAAGSTASVAAVAFPDYVIVDSRGSGEEGISPPGTRFIDEFERLRPGALIRIVEN